MRLELLAKRSTSAPRVPTLPRAPDPGGYDDYRLSKTALNMAGRSLAVDLKPRGIAVAISSWAPILRAASSAFTSSYWASGQPSVSRSTGLSTGLQSQLLLAPGAASKTARGSTWESRPGTRMASTQWRQEVWRSRQIS